MMNKNTTMLGWKRFLNTTPTLEYFREAWKLIFEYYPEECVLFGVSGGRNAGFSVETPIATHFNGGFGFHTDAPDLDDPEDEWYDGYGCTWSTDKNEVRYYKLDKETGLPVGWDKARAKETIRDYIKNNSKTVNSLFIQHKKELQQ